MTVRLREIARLYLKKVVANEINEDGMAKIRELRSEENWAEMETFIEELVMAARYLK